MMGKTVGELVYKILFETDEASRKKVDKGVQDTANQAKALLNEVSKSGKKLLAGLGIGISLKNLWTTLSKFNGVTARMSLIRKEWIRLLTSVDKATGIGKTIGDWLKKGNDWLIKRAKELASKFEDFIDKMGGTEEFLKKFLKLATAIASVRMIDRLFGTGNIKATLIVAGLVAILSAAKELTNFLSGKDSKIEEILKKNGIDVDEFRAKIKKLGDVFRDSFVRIKQALHIDADNSVSFLSGLINKFYEWLIKHEPEISKLLTGIAKFAEGIFVAEDGKLSPFEHFLNLLEGTLNIVTKIMSVVGPKGIVAFLIGKEAFKLTDKAVSGGIGLLQKLINFATDGQYTLADVVIAKLNHQSLDGMFSESGKALLSKETVTNAAGLGSKLSLVALALAAVGVAAWSIVNAVKYIKAWRKGETAEINPFFDKITDKIADVIYAVSKSLSKVKEAVKEKIKDIWNGIKDFFKSLQNTMSDWFKNSIIGQLISLVFHLDWNEDEVDSEAKTINKKIKDSVGSIGLDSQEPEDDEPFTPIGSGPNKGGLGNQFGVGSHYIHNFANGLKSGLGSVKEAVSDINGALNIGNMNTVSDITAKVVNETSSPINVTQNVKISNSFSGSDRAAQAEGAKVMTQAAEDATSQMARALRVAGVM